MECVFNRNRERNMIDCRMCEEEFDDDMIMDVNGFSVCYSCGLQFVCEELATQQEVDEIAKNCSVLMKASGIKVTNKGVMYYPDEDHDNVYHLIGLQMVEF